MAAIFSGLLQIGKLVHRNSLSYELVLKQEICVLFECCYFILFLFADGQYDRRKSVAVARIILDCYKDFCTMNQHFSNLAPQVHFSI